MVDQETCPMHEFDESGNRYSYALDAADLIDPSLGVTYASFVRDFLVKNNLTLPTDAKFLGFGCGQGLTELIFAAKLGIPESSMVLVDKFFSETTRKVFDENNPEVRLIRSGMFAFLTNPPETGFSVVSAFAIEYLLDTRERMQYLITSLPKVLRPGSIVFVDYPISKRDMIYDWKENGFTPLHPDIPADPLMFFAGK